jgi:hypothetical protein
MDRAAFRKEKRRLTEERMGTPWTPIYDENCAALDAIGAVIHG